MAKKTLFTSILKFLADRSYKSFLISTRELPQYNFKILQEILKLNRYTEYGLKYNFDSIKTIKEYQKQIPLTTYEDYETYIDRMAAGAGKILTTSKVRFFGLTSGTTGKSKIIPISRKSGQIMAARISLLGLYVVCKYFPGLLHRGRSLHISNSVITQFTQAGIPVGAITANSAQRTRNIRSFINTSPSEISALSNYQDELYLHLLFALTDRNLKSINATFASTILDLFYHLESNWQSLLTDLEQGTINRQIMLEPPVRQRLQNKLRSRIKPASFRQQIKALHSEFIKGMTGIAARIWPKLVCITTITSGTFGVYAEKCRPYMQTIPFYSPFYAATEAMIGINLEPEKNYYTIMPGAAFFEFIPAAAVEDTTPNCLTIDALTAGEEYEVVITNYSGFYRYRMRDIVKVVAYLNRLPVVEFIRRKGTLLNLVGEKTGIAAVCAALKEAFPEPEYIIMDYTIYPDHDTLPGFYNFYIEFKKGSPGQEAGARLETALCRANPRYTAARTHNKLDVLKIHILKKGTFAEYKNRLVHQGASPNQVKIPHVLTDPGKLAFFKEQV